MGTSRVELRAEWVALGCPVNHPYWQLVTRETEEAEARAPKAGARVLVSPTNGEPSYEATVIGPRVRGLSLRVRDDAGQRFECLLSIVRAL